EEDTLKLMECTRRCLKTELNQIKYVSWKTYGQRSVFAIHAIGNKITLLSTQRLSPNKWSYIEMRSAKVPRTWADRFNFFRVFELLFTLK
ncbi:hypothetical protein DM01DRAFT_1271925, partial [Hesseltinella vesiculosa]